MKDIENSKKESPMLGLTGMGGGVASLMWASAGEGPYDLWSWGQNSNGTLGHNNQTDYSSPKQVPGNWMKVATGRNYSCSAGIKEGGTLWTWGANSQGDLGHNNKTQYSSPKQVGTGTDWADIAGTQYGMCGLKTDGTLWTWGGNMNGILGLNAGGNPGRKSSPTQVGTNTNWATIQGGAFISCTKTDGTLWCWGDNGQGQLGVNTTKTYSSPVQVGTDTTWSLTGRGGGYNFLATKTDNTLWVCGFNGQAQLGLGSPGPTKLSSPTQLSGGGYTSFPNRPFTSTGASGVASGTKLLMWGLNNYGQKGNGNTTTDVTNNFYDTALDGPWLTGAATENTSGAIKENGELWMWGYNNWGMCAQGTSGNSYSSPRQVGTDTDWVELASASEHSFMALKKQ